MNEVAIDIESGLKSDQAVANAMSDVIGNALSKHYPNRQWRVGIAVGGLVARIFCPAISNEYGYQIKLLNYTMMGLEKEAIFAGGEILERYGLSRERGASGGEESILKDHRGNAIMKEGI